MHSFKGGHSTRLHADQSFWPPLYFDRHAEFSAWQEILTSIKTCMVFPSQWPCEANDSFENLIRGVNPTVEPIPPIWAGAQGSACTAETAEALHI